MRQEGLFPKYTVYRNREIEGIITSHYMPGEEVKTIALCLDRRDPQGLMTILDHAERMLADPNHRQFGQDLVEQVGQWVQSTDVKWDKYENGPTKDELLERQKWLSQPAPPAGEALTIGISRSDGNTKVFVNDEVWCKQPPPDHARGDLWSASQLQLLNRVREWLHTNVGLSSSWLLEHLTGIPLMRSDWGGHTYPSDPADFNRCLQMLEAFPEYRPLLPALMGKNKIWDRVLERWDEIERCLLEEKERGGKAPRTLALLRECRDLHSCPQCNSTDTWTHSWDTKVMDAPTRKCRPCEHVFVVG